MNNDSKMITKLFFYLLPVQILMVAIGSINSIIDGAMASNFISPDALAVTGLYSPVLKVIETVNTVLLGGSQILCGQFLGKNQIERTREVFSLDMVIITVLSLLFTGAGLLFPGPLSVLLGANQEVKQGLTQYILGISGGILPQMLATQLTAFLQIEQQERRTYVGIAAMMITNISLDYIFIKILGMGMFGLGLATTLSYAVFFIILGLYYISSKAVIKFIWSHIKFNDLGLIIAIGIPGAVGTFCLAIRGVTLNALLLGTTGNDGISALSALNTFGYLLYAVTAGLAAATRLLISVYIGEEDRDSIIAVMKTALFKGVLMVCGVAAVVLLLAGPLTYIFYKDTSSNVYYLTDMLFRIYPFSMPLSAICIIFENYYQSSNRMKIVNILSVTDGILGIGLACLVLAPLYGAIGIWEAHVVNGIITTIVIIVYACIKNKRIPRSFVDLLTIPDDFGVPDDMRLDIMINNAEDVTNTSQKISDFCNSHGIDHKRSFFAGLCMEEMAANIVEHGLDDGKKHYIEVRIVYKDDELTLRIKDDCRAFDPKEQLALIDPEDITSNIGLRMIDKLAKTLSYTNMLGLNVFTVTL